MCVFGDFAAGETLQTWFDSTAQHNTEKAV
jgi:hypothetical protein